MAYYSSSYYEADDHGKYYSTPYADYHDHSALGQGSILYPSYEPTAQNFFQYDPTLYHHACHQTTPTWPTITYSTSAYSKPVSIEYKPKFYGDSYDTEVTQFVISYSVSEVNEPEYEDYDPTPYDGGFDLAQVYGKPLPPSDETCYPLSGVTSDGSTTPLLGGKKDIDQEQASKPINESQPTQAVQEEEKHQESSEDQPSQVVNENGHETEGNPNQVEDSDEIQGSDHEHNLGSGSYEYEKQVHQIPSGYGLEAMDICEGLFGYWPCLSRDFKRGSGNCQEFSGEGRYGNPWNGTADYLFGSSNPYGETRDEGNYHGGPFYNYERHYLEQPQNRQG